MRLILVVAAAIFPVLVAGQQGCECGPHTYTTPEVASAILAGDGRNPNPTTSSGPYPKLFDNRERVQFPDCNANLIQFPLRMGGSYSGGPPGPDRVVYQKDGKFCGCMTHFGALGNRLAACRYF
ncbi:Ribonuclease/ribotoxin [Linnemannia elongata]|nr:Ribonuclease/ribotoxin [Linnemannia elongata]